MMKNYYSAHLGQYEKIELRMLKVPLTLNINSDYIQEKQI